MRVPSLFLASTVVACGPSHAEPSSPASATSASPDPTSASPNPTSASPNPTSASPSAASASLRDAHATDPDKYRVVLDNEHVRVLDYIDHPGDRTSLHHHPDFVLHALGPFQRRLSFPDGTSRVVSFHGGETVFMTAQTHAGENIGATDTHVLIVELKAR